MRKSLLLLLLLLLKVRDVVSWHSLLSSSSLKPTTHTRTALAAANTGAATDSNIEIRHCRYSELPECANLIMKAFQEEEEESDDELLLSEMQQAFPRQEPERAHYRMLVAVHGDDETVVGFVDVNFRYQKQKSTRRPYVGNLCVSDSFRRKGLARALVQAAQQFVVLQSNRPCTTMYVRVESSNKAARQLYEREGYQRIDNPDCSNGSMILLTKELL
mmetsp:Transcript_26750/g.39569  ORF Transcript_26750/g.39569 Transcript_26750/m.39569 type:complete len:217 (-) Transcript_26750:109-759(-)